MGNLKEIILLSAVTSLSASCVSYKTPTLEYYSSDTRETHREVRIEAAQHPLYNFIPRRFEQIKPYDIPHFATWLILGNEPDGIFGEEYSPPYHSEISYFNAFKWTVVRNPLANFKNYIIGTDYLDKHHNFSFFSVDSKRGIRFMKKEKDLTVFGTGPNTFQFQLNDFKPYISFKIKLSKKRKFDFGVGWKDRGNFGLKFRPFVKRDSEDY